MKKIRCAIYTRKSSEEELDQEFNSLHAQREACAAYIASQKHEGWIPLPHHPVPVKEAWRRNQAGDRGSTIESS